MRAALDSIMTALRGGSDAPIAASLARAGLLAAALYVAACAFWIMEPLP